MFRSGNITIPVSDMDRAVRFYTEVLGLPLAYRFGDHWASIQVGTTLTIGLHPGAPQPGASVHGGMSIGLELSGSMEDAVASLETKGVKFAGPIRDGKSGKFAAFTDPDGNSLYLTQLNWTHVNQGEGNYPA